MGLVDGLQPHRIPFYPFTVTHTTDRQDGNTAVGQSFYLYPIQNTFPANSKYNHKQRESAGWASWWR